MALISRIGMAAMVLGLASATSHLVVKLLKIETTTGRQWVTGKQSELMTGVISGSSLAGNAIDWYKVGGILGENLGGWGVAGSSPWEWERYQRTAQEAKSFYVVVSLYDLNEQFLCDFHADVVRVTQTFQDLKETNVDAAFWKRVVSQYPLSYVRNVFPTAGRSMGVMAGARDELRSLLKQESRAGAGPVMATGNAPGVSPVRRERISEWPEARTLRRVAIMRTACEGQHWYGGPKSVALMRMLRDAVGRGPVNVIVVPVSPRYVKEFVGKEVERQFDTLLRAGERATPQARWVRLDHLPELRSDRYYYDLVHLNVEGQKVATRAFLTCLGRQDASL